MGASSVDWLARAQDGVTIFLGVVIEATPFLVLGVLVSQVLALAVRLTGWCRDCRAVDSRPSTALAGLGAAFPVCECGNVPVARRLIRRGVPAGAALVFLLSAPALNPVVALSTFAAFRDRPSIVVLRLSLTFAVAVAIGLLFSFHPQPAAMLRRGVRCACRGPTGSGGPGAPGAPGGSPGASSRSSWRWAPSSSSARLSPP